LTISDFLSCNDSHPVDNGQIPTMQNPFRAVRSFVVVPALAWLGNLLAVEATTKVLKARSSGGIPVGAKLGRKARVVFQSGGSR
jgi:hypothetical protein